MRRLICLALLCAFAAFGQGKGNGKGKGKGNSGGSTESSVQISFDRDRGVIREYLRSVPAGNLPPGLAKRGGNLPPGLEKQLQRNGHLPPGLEKNLYPFPVELERRLPPLPPDYGRAFIGGHAVIYIKSTSVILDVFIPL